MASGEAGKALNVTSDTLTRAEGDAALLIAEDELIDEVIAAKVGITKRTVERWKKRPDILARVAEHKEAFKDAALTNGFADKRARLKALDALAFDLMGDMGQPATPDAPKGTYRKEIKLSANGEAVEYVVYDKAKADSFRGYLDDIAKEVGERATKAEVSGPNGEPAFKVYVNISPSEL